jgi:hypothetical protein
MRFKREDIGLYLATVLIGGGAGLLVGAFITARINKKQEEAEEELIPEEVTYDPDDPPDHVKELEKETEEEEEEDIPLKELKSKTLPKKKSSGKKRFRLSKEDRNELNRLSSQYVITGMQVELVESGIMSVDELGESLLEEEIIAEESLPIEVGNEDGTPTDYNSPYRYNDLKPDMDDLLQKPDDDAGPRNLEDLLVVVDERWEISLEPPVGKDEQQKRIIYFDPDDETVFTKTDGGDPVPADLRVITTPEVRDLVMPWLLFEEEMEVIYINDIRNKRTRWWEIVRIGSDEDTSEHDDASY